MVNPKKTEAEMEIQKASLEEQALTGGSFFLGEGMKKSNLKTENNHAQKMAAPDAVQMAARKLDWVIALSKSGSFKNKKPKSVNKG
jgi:hypothetical protein